MFWGISLRKWCGIKGAYAEGDCDIVKKMLGQVRPVANDENEAEERRRLLKLLDMVKVERFKAFSKVEKHYQGKSRWNSSIFHSVYLSADVSGRALRKTQHWEDNWVSEWHRLWGGIGLRFKTWARTVFKHYKWTMLTFLWNCVYQRYFKSSWGWGRDESEWHW